VGKPYGVLPHRVCGVFGGRAALLHAPTNVFSKKLDNHMAAIALHFMHYNFARPHSTLTNPYPRTPAMAAGVADHVWTMTEIAGLLDEPHSTDLPPDPFLHFV
jgi:hypothetical protein